MSNSYKKPYLKAKLRWFQLYHNRRERRLSKQALKKGDYLLPERRMTPAQSHDVIDYVAYPGNHHGEKWAIKASRK